MVGVWTGKDDAAIRQRMITGGFEPPRRAPLAGFFGADKVSRAQNSLPPQLALPLVALNLVVVVIYFFRGAAWAGMVRAKSGTTPVSADELASRLEAFNSLHVSFQVERGTLPNEFHASWRHADATWTDLARARGLKRTFRVRLALDARGETVRATDYSASYDWSAGRGGAELEWKASLGIVFFQFNHQRVFGLQYDGNGRLKPALSYAYTFNVNEMKSALIEAVTRAGWHWRPTVWQGPAWLRWLTECT
jgi:hypothetical protein